MTPTASSVGPRLLPPELAEAGLNVDVDISVEVGIETLLGGLPTPKTMLTQSQYKSASHNEAYRAIPGKDYILITDAKTDQPHPIKQKQQYKR